MSENGYITKKEIIEELLYKDRNFFSSNNPEFNIFKYTAFFAVLTFTFQFIIVIINSFRGFGYLAYSHSLVFELSIIFIIALIELYYGLTHAMRKSYHNGKGVYLRLYKCMSCDFTSYSEFYSNLHIVSHPDHTLKDNQILIKYENFNYRPWFLRISVISRRNRIDKNSDREFAVQGESDLRNSEEIKGSKWDLVRLIGVILLISIIPVYLYWVYSLYRSPEIVIVSLIIFGTGLMIRSYIQIALMNEDIKNVYLFKVELVDQEEKGNPYIIFKYVKMAPSYWEWVEKKSEMEPIEVQDGELYIVDKIVLNKFAEIIEVSHE
ncbi:MULTISPECIES: hypothetical protein [Ferroplasma]|uniref:Uncharacterized protein n=1 Tax=Ferroplasma acidarmanus Fer1 TaxID=333146 RepID=S0ARG4_FERAC|nr:MULTISPECIES: hypothetical protein [Ferroplasma]AGO61372.1 hypothetical protein FACI_IFERC00001G1392 [Ferroplasma acidarmanus Fer1]WMT52198.1 MAG: hypothetical protein RE471_04790 [Ferroplasma sp.]